MAGRIDVQVDPEQVVRQIVALQTRTRHLDMGDLAEELQALVDDVFQAEGAVAGAAKWSPLKATTLKRNPRRRGRAILQASSQMMAMQAREGEWWAEVKSPAEYAGFHVSGTSQMVRRDFLAIDSRQLAENVGLRILQEIVRF